MDQLYVFTYALPLAPASHRALHPTLWAIAEHRLALPVDQQLPLAMSVPRSQSGPRPSPPSLCLRPVLHVRFSIPSSKYGVREMVRSVEREEAWLRAQLAWGAGRGRLKTFPGQVVLRVRGSGP